MMAATESSSASFSISARPPSIVMIDKGLETPRISPPASLITERNYGLVWILKDVAFPDPSWQRRITIAGGIYSFIGVLGWYWVFGWLLISGTSQPDYPLPDFAWVWLGLFAVNMVMKEASMSRYPEWAAYKKRTWWLIPYVL